MPKTHPPLQEIMPPLVCGTGTFNIQYNADPFSVPANSMVARALTLGVRAFDTSPYYGPSESILGAALDTPFVKEHFSRRDYFLITKAGRIGMNCFDYSPSWIRASVQRSLERLRTSYLDVVYCHDAEFVTPGEVLDAVNELRRIRDTTGAVKYVGISGYPVPVLCELAELVLAETGEPLDVVMSYCNFTLQNSSLLTQGLERLRRAGVGVVPNASVLAMGLLRSNGLPLGSAGDWHPAPSGLRAASKAAADFCAAQGDKIEKVAIRYSMEGWLHAGSSVGTRGDPPSGIEFSHESIEEVGGRRLGCSLFGCSNVAELEETLAVWRSILDTLDGGKNKGREPDEREWGNERMEVVRKRAEGVRACFGEWADFAWSSPHEGFVNEPNPDKPVDEEEEEEEWEEEEEEEDGHCYERATLKAILPLDIIKDVPDLRPIEFVDADKITPMISTDQFMLSTPGSSPERTPLQKPTILPDFD